MDEGELHRGRLADQILLRALMHEVVKRLAQQSPNPEQATREICGSLQDFVNGYTVPGADRHELEHAKERARLNLDQLSNSLRRSDPT